MCLTFISQTRLASLTSDGNFHLFEISDNEIRRLFSQEISKNHCPTKMIYHNDQEIIVKFLTSILYVFNLVVFFNTKQALHN